MVAALVVGASLLPQHSPVVSGITVTVSDKHPRYEPIVGVKILSIPHPKNTRGLSMYTSWRP